MKTGAKPNQFFIGIFAPSLFWSVSLVLVFALAAWRRRSNAALFGSAGGAVLTCVASAELIISAQLFPWLMSSAAGAIFTVGTAAIFLQLAALVDEASATMLFHALINIIPWLLGLWGLRYAFRGEKTCAWIAALSSVVATSAVFVDILPTERPPHLFPALLSCAFAATGCVCALSARRRAD